MEEYKYLTEHVTMWNVAVERQICVKGPDAGKMASWRSTSTSPNTSPCGTSLSSVRSVSRGPMPARWHHGGVQVPHRTRHHVERRCRASDLCQGARCRQDGIMEEYKYLTEHVTMWNVAVERQICVKGPDA